MGVKLTENTLCRVPDVVIVEEYRDILGIEESRFYKTLANEDLMYGPNQVLYDYNEILRIASIFETEIQVIQLSFTDFISDAGLDLVTVKASEIVEKLGDDAVKDAVISVLYGKNIRSVTEALTRTRLSRSYGATLKAFMDAQHSIPYFSEKLPFILLKERQSTKNPTKRLYLNWLIGLTKKGYDNILRGDDQNLKEYVPDMDNWINEVAEDMSVSYGKVNSTFASEGVTKDSIFDWKTLLYLMSAIGSQTLAIRGSEKSAYGKLFEKLVLFSLLQILGFDVIQKDPETKSSMVFWLSSAEEGERESDATIIVSPGFASRVDIGFIGKGNPEISLDKVSRYAREMEQGGKSYYSTTIVIIDTVGERSRIFDLANQIDGSIIQMNSNFWVKRIAETLHAKLNYGDELAFCSDGDSLKLIAKRMRDVDFESFLQLNI
jgi:hypothetical protein